MNQTGQELYELIDQLRRGKHSDEYSTEFGPIIEKKLSTWKDDILIGPYFPVLMEICQGRRGDMGDAVYRIVKFLCSYESEDKNSSRLLANFYSYLKFHPKIWPMFPLNANYGFQCIRNGNHRAFAVMFPCGQVILPGEKCTKNFVLSQPNQDWIRIPIFRGLSSYIDRNERGNEVSGPFPTKLRENFSDENGKNSKIKVTFERRRRQFKDLHYKLEWVNDTETHLIMEGDLYNQFDDLIIEEESSLDDPEKWRKDLRMLLDLCFNLIKFSKKDPKLKLFSKELMKYRDKAVTVLRSGDERQGWEMIGEIIDILLGKNRTGPIFFIFLSNQFIKKNAPDLFPKLEPLTKELLNAKAIGDQEKINNILEGIKKIRKFASEKREDGAKLRYATLLLQRNLYGIGKALYKGVEKSNLNFLRVNRNLEKLSFSEAAVALESLVKAADTLLKNYSEFLNPQLIKKIEDNIEKAKQALKSNDQLLVIQSIDVLRWNLIHSGFPGIMAFFATLDGATLKSYPNLQRMATYVKEKWAFYNDALKRGNQIEVAKIFGQVLAEWYSVHDGFSQSAQELPFMINVLGKAFEFSKIIDQPVLTFGSERDQLRYLVRIANGALNYSRIFLPEADYIELSNLVKKAEKIVVSGNFSEMAEIAEQIAWTLFAGGAYFVAFLVDSSFKELEDSFKPDLGNRIPEMLKMYEQGETGKWRSLAAPILDDMETAIENRITVTEVSDHKMKFELILAQALQLQLEDKADDAKEMIDRALSPSDKSAVEKLKLVRDVAQRFFKSEYAQQVDPDQIKQLRELVMKAGIVIRKDAQESRRMRNIVYGKLLDMPEKVFKVVPEEKIQQTLARWEAFRNLPLADVERDLTIFADEKEAYGLLVEVE